MRILWVNNIADICGGTFQATHSMCKALPDCQHTLFVPGKVTLNIEGHDAFAGLNYLFVSRESVTDYVVNECQNRFDLVVYQNTGMKQLEGIERIKAETFYYLHSSNSSTKHVPAKFKHFACVSNYLATQVGWNIDHVLYQPVTTPKYLSDIYGIRDECSPYRIVRLANRNKNKWDTQDLIYELTLIKETRYPCELLWCGFNGELHQWETIVNQMCPNVTQFTIFGPSLLNRSAVQSANLLLNSCDINETYGRTVCEAQRSNCLPLVRKVGGYVEQIEDSGGEFITGDANVDAKTLAYCMLNKHVPSSFSAANRSGLSQFRKRFLELLSK